jgi:hypothetical protein
MVHAMNPTDLDAADYEMLGAVSRRLQKGQFEAFTAQGQGCGWCRHPVRLRGVVIANDGGGRRLVFSTGQLPDGVVLKACGSRRETRCPSCAAVYRADARHLVRAGLIGGKGVPEEVMHRPAVLLTLTAPSFGAVHTAKDSGPCHPASPSARCAHGRSLSCFVHHEKTEACVGSALCEDCYDYEGAVLHNATTPELWRRTTIYLVRHLAQVLGKTQAETKALISLSFCRVVEYQRRGVVHIHAVVRADGIQGELHAVTIEELARAALSAARAVTVPHSRGTSRWGRQIDVQALDRSDGQRAQKIAGYVAKYATKSSDEDGTLDSRITSLDDLARRHLGPHIRRMAEVAWALGDDPQLGQFHLHRHAHGLGYGGQFLSKSRGYSTSFGALKAARVAWRTARKAGGVTSPDHSLDARWRAVGIGWANQGEVRWAEWRRRQRAEEFVLANEDRYWI